MSPIPVRQYSKGRTGIGLVSIRGNKVDIVFEDNEQAVSILLEDAPSYIRAGRQAITLNSNNTEIYAARPLGGTHRAIFVGFAGKENEPPTIRNVESKSGTSHAGKKYFIKEHLEFTALFDVVSGKWKNYRLVYNMPYSFEEYVDEASGKSITLVYGEKVTKFLQLCGLDFSTDSIPWSDNVLVFLQKLLLARAKPIAIALNDTGWVKDMSEIPEEEDEEEEKKDLTIGAGVTKVTTPAVHLDTEETETETKPKAAKKAPSAPGILDIIAQNAKAGDADALKMLTSLANTNPQAKAKLEEIISDNAA